MAARKPRAKTVEPVVAEEVTSVKPEDILKQRQKMTIEYRADGAKVTRTGGMVIVSY